MDLGALPNLARLVQSGASARLASTLVPISSAAWVGAMTGRNPAGTGVYGFFEPVEATYDVRLTSSLSNRATPLWRILTRRGLGTIVFGVPLTYPPEAVFGTMVAGMLSPFDATYAYPPEYTDTLRARGFEPDLSTWREERPLTMEHLEAQLELKRELVLELLAGADWRCAIVVFKNLDTLSHRSYGDDFAQQVAPLYVELDRVLGDMVAAVGTETNVLVMSDHGFRPYRFGFNLHLWLLEQGFAARNATAEDDDTPAGPLAVRRPLERRRRLASLDWSRTEVYAVECEGNSAGLRLNLVGREPRGIVSAGRAESVLERLETRLLDWRTQDGEALVTRVVRSTALYPGPHRDALPDLLLELAPGVQATAGLDGLVLGQYARAVPDHDREGLFVAAGPDIRPSETRAEAAIFDVAPTALALLGLPVYAEMDGRVLLQLLRDTPTTLTIPEAEDPFRSNAPGPAATPFDASELREIERRLEALGYTE